jgi:3-oxoacyl-[acyl-carrier-protein] synthase-3
MLYLHGMGHFYPENVITNEFLEELDIGSSAEWILERVGIRTRRTCLPLDYIKTTKNSDSRAALEAALYNNAQTGAAAAGMALERAGLKPEDIGMIISGSSAPDHVAPSEAAAIAAELGIEALCFDVTSACTTYGMQVGILSKMKPGTVPPYILIVNPENFTRVVDYSKRGDAALFGDATSASVLSLEVPSRLAFTHAEGDSKPSAWTKVFVPRLGYFQQDGNAVQGFAIRKTTECLRSVRSMADADADTFMFIGHQANLGMLKTVCERCGISDQNHWFNVADFGNTASAGAPGTLSLHWDELKPGTDVGIVIVGAGLTWVSLLLKATGKAVER